MGNPLGPVAAWWGRLRKAIALAPHIDDLHAAFEEREEGGALTRHERELLENTLTFGAITADEVSVPRSDIVAIGSKARFADVLEAFRDSTHSRLPVIGRSLDDVKGLVTLKDVLSFVGREDKFELDEILRPATFVPETMLLPRVLQVMKKTHVPLVMVTDEFGGTSGLISLKDIVEELVGDIEDEHDQSSTAPIMPLGAGMYRIQGDFALEDMDEQLGTNLVENVGDDVETLGGAILKVAKTVPGRGETFRLDERVKATVTATDGRRILNADVAVSEDA